MQNSKELKLLKKEGYVIIDLPNKHYLIQARNNIIEKINTILKTNILDIEKMRSFVGGLDLNSLDQIRKMQLEGISEKLIKAVGHKIKIASKNSIYLQRYPHLNLNISNLKESKTISHNEIMSGHSPNTIVCWMPLHDVLDESGLYLLEKKKSMKLYKTTKNFKKIFPTDNELSKIIPKCLKIKFGQAILFNAFSHHGAKNHTRKKSRISIDIRFQDIQYPLFEKNLDYFKIFKLKNLY